MIWPNIGVKSGTLEFWNKFKLSHQNILLLNDQHYNIIQMQIQVPKFNS